MRIILEGLPKVSLNEIYAGSHWRKRKSLKDNYIAVIKSQFKTILPKDKTYSVEYIFHFKSRALDVSNTVYMLKMIEDIIFEDDSYKIVKELNIKSIKADHDHVEIIVSEL